jgi:hypothetical protein
MSRNDVKIHEVIEEVSMKGPLKIEQSSSPWLTLTFHHDNESQTNGMDKDRAQEPHQDIQNKEKYESFNSIGHEDYHHI